MSVYLLTCNFWKHHRFKVTRNEISPVRRIEDTDLFKAFHLILYWIKIFVAYSSLILCRRQKSARRHDTSFSRRQQENGRSYEKDKVSQGHAKDTCSLWCTNGYPCFKGDALICQNERHSWGIIPIIWHVVFDDTSRYWAKRSQQLKTRLKSLYRTCKKHSLSFDLPPFWHLL